MPDLPEDLVSRFFTAQDRRSASCVFDLPDTEAWSFRPYEYRWAAEFAEDGDVVLDAACGICHPLKFLLADSCREVHACDLDPRIGAPEAMLGEIAEVFGPEAARNLPRRCLEWIRYVRASVTALPYRDASFDKVYCISVLEHLEDGFNRRPVLMAGGALFRRWVRHDIRTALGEFKRVLKPGGRLILTFDYPRINLAYFRSLVRQLGLAFAGEASFSVPEDALALRSSAQYHCFRAALCVARTSGAARFRGSGSAPFVG